MESSQGNVSGVAVDSGKREPRSISIWWWLSPTILFVVVSFGAGFVESLGHASPLVRMISYSLGEILGGFCIAGIIAGVVFFITRLSVNAFAITWAIVLCLTSFGLVTTEMGRLTRTMQALRAAKAVPVMASFGDFRFEIPGQWVKAKTSGPQTPALIIFSGKSIRTDVQRGAIEVQAAPSSRTVHDIAVSLAKGDGVIDPVPTYVDGVYGIHVEFASATKDHPRDLTVFAHDGKAYVVMAGEDNGSDVLKAMEHVLKTWRWE